MSYTQLRIRKPTLAKLRMLATLRRETAAGLVDRLVEQELERMEPATAQLIRDQAGKDPSASPPQSEGEKPQPTAAEVLDRRP